MNNHDFGQKGEAAACEHLSSLNYTIVEKNFRCRMGEIDIIARDGRSLVFVEVKTRLSTQCGQPFEAVTWYKQQRLRKLAMYYLKLRFGTIDVLGRFDVVSIFFSDNDREIRHFKNAF